MKKMHPKAMRNFKKILAPRHVLSTTQTRITAPISQQTAQTVASFTNAGGTQNAILSILDYGQMFTNLVADETIPTSSVAVTQRMWMKRANARYQMKNQTTGPITVWWYDLIARRDVESQASGIYDPVALWNLGIQDEVIGITPVNPSSFPGTTPFKSEAFCQYWNVKKVNRWVLHPGSEHTHFVNVNVGRLVNAEYAERNIYNHGETYVPLVVVRGGIIQDTSTPFNVTYGTAELDIICDTRYVFTALQKNRTVYQSFTSLPSAVTVPGIVLEDTDAVATNVVV